MTAGEPQEAFWPTRRAPWPPPQHNQGTIMADNITALAELFPRAFTTERWRPHKPLKVGVHADLIATGALTPREVRAALRVYTKRRMYLAAVAAGGFRHDLDGNPAGEVNPYGSRMGAGKVGPARRSGNGHGPQATRNSASVPAGIAGGVSGE
jgi:hypothetical protein